MVAITEWSTVKGVTKRPDQADSPSIDGEDFLRALLNISPEDAEEVRERTPGTRPEKPRQEGPTADYGDEETR